MSNARNTDLEGPLDAYRTTDRLQARIAMHERFGNTSFDLHSWIFDLLLNPGAAEPLVPDAAKVLEVGAGTGRMWQVVAGRVPPGWSLTLTDRSPGMLEALRRLTQELGLDANVEEADAGALRYPDATFDLAFANHMLYHLPDPRLGVAELRRVLKPGGLLVAATNGAGHMRQATDLVRPLAALEGLQLMGVEPLSFTCESGRVMLEERFSNVELRRQDDELQVTDLEVLLAYLRSLIHLPSHPEPATLSALAEWEATVRSLPLPFAVERATGVFFARA